MPLIVKPISANLTTDKDFLGKSVRIILVRILTALYTLEMKSKELKAVVVEEKVHNGKIRSNSIQLTKCLESKFGMTIHSATIKLDKELLI